MCVFKAQWATGGGEGEGILRSSSDRDDRMGKKSKPAKIPRALNKTQTTSWTKI